MLGKGIRSRAVLAPAFPPLILPVIFSPNWIVWVIVAGVSGGWVLFVAWRTWRMTKATVLKSDREYDQKGKFQLSREYWGSESATAARRHKK
jgi:hypothetical protein